MDIGQPVGNPEVKIKPSIPIYDAVSTAFEAANDGIDLEELARASDCPDPRLEGIGANRSGAGWNQGWANFVSTSAFVRLLGSEEQFENDVLKGPLSLSTTRIGRHSESRSRAAMRL